MLLIGSDAVCSDGYPGEVRGIVLAPVAGVVTHVVVEPRGRTGLARLVPLGLVDAAAEPVALRCTEAAFRDLDAAEEDLAEFVAGYPDPVQLLPAGWRGAGGPTAEGAEIPRVVEQEDVDVVPTGEVQESRGDRVHGIDGDLGQLRGLLIDPESGEITHVLVRQGPPWARQDIAVPFGAIAGFDDGVKLGVTRRQARDLAAGGGA